MRIDASGNVGIGTTDPATYGGLTLQQSSNTSSKGLAIVDSTAAQSVKLWVDGTNSYLSSGNTGADPLVLNLGGGNVGIGDSTFAAGKLQVYDSAGNHVWLKGRASDGTSSVSFRNNADNAYNGRIQVADTGGMLFQVAGSTRATIDASGHAIIPAGVTLGTATGVYAAANTLDDYEEGTFTATLRGSTSEPATLITATGLYTKIGRNVTYKLDTGVMDTTGYAGVITISGFPFANNTGRHIGTAASYSAVTFTTYLVSLLGGGGTVLEIMDIRSDNSWASGVHNAGTTRYIWVSGTYKTDS
jgi:hypothetical protein